VAGTPHHVWSRPCPIHYHPIFSTRCTPIGGIGENDGEVRKAVCAGLDWAGVVIEDNRENPSVPRRGVCVLPSQEDEQIARHTRALALRGV
jgi:acetate kinase